MTLVELMIVTGIILMLVVISVPVVRPMLQSRKQADAAQILSIYLNSARIRASETGRDCGVMFERYTDNNINGITFPNNDSCLIVRQIEVPPPYVGMASNVRVSVEPNNAKDKAEITFHHWNGNSWSVSDAEDVYWNSMVRAGDKIQFDNQGPFYTISQVSSNMSATSRQFPTIAIQTALSSDVIRRIPATSPVQFKVLRLPTSQTVSQLTLAPPIGFPSGIIVDLRYSGISDKEDWPDLVPQLSDFCPASSDTNDPVIVMFSPSGTVSLIRPDAIVDNDKKGNEPIHFLIGRWDRSGIDWDNKTRDDFLYEPEDGLHNYEDLSNFWVSIDQVTGRVRTSPVAPVLNPGSPTALAESRRYANQSHQ